jgi:putative oxygen-independent coproporphyrinogen III oxidase
MSITSERRNRVNPGGLGVYVHFPWCLSKCPYCDFVAYGAAPDSIDHAGYADAVLAEFAGRHPSLSDRRLASIFIGGGTPSLWHPAELARVLARVFASFAAEGSQIEVSIETDPSSLDYDRARAWMDAGVDRLSIGVQALDDARLEFLGRVHTAAEARAAMGAAVRAGVPRISADLLYAVAGQTPEDAAREARELTLLGATHVSAYGLTVEPDTPFGHLARRGKLPLYDDVAMAEAFFAIDAALTGAGLRHYEISNYAAPGQEARHNLGYWRGRDYLGLGCGAYGTITLENGTARRYRNDPNPRAYLSRTAADGRSVLEPAGAADEWLDPTTRLRERIMLGLRMKEGIDLEAAAAEIGADPFPSGRLAALEELALRGRIVRRGAQVAIPLEAWIWADQTAASLF